MKNHDIFQQDPLKGKLINDGVAVVNDDESDHAMQVLRREIESFVCEGQFEKGLGGILSTYLGNLNQPTQPAAWISGFFGSGKSHMAKMIRALWVDTEFSDGATARGLANLPRSVVEPLKELSIQAKRHGGVFAASGTLGATSRDKSVRLALLSVIFRAAGLPENFARAKFVLWLRKEKIEEAVQKHLRNNDYDYKAELEDMYVSDGLQQALTELKPTLFSAPGSYAIVMENQFPDEKDISNDDMLTTIRRVIGTPNGGIPLTLLVLDEIQQYIGENQDKPREVEEVVESVSKGIGSKVLFIGTGQAAITGTPLLKKMEGRFTVRVELSESDVDAVIRNVVLAKKPESQAALSQVMTKNLGEISRHLQGTAIGHRQEDVPVFVQDYPMLPVRRRFWDRALRVLDQTGTESQLRNQLSVIHKAIQLSGEMEIGTVVPGDYLFFETAAKLVEAFILPRDIFDQTMKWQTGTPDERLLARACGIVFLMSKIADVNKDIKIRTDINSIADLLVTDLNEGSGTLRARLPQLLDGSDVFMKTGDEYRIQTPEGQAWNADFQAERKRIAGLAHSVPTARRERLVTRATTELNKIKLSQGTSKTHRDLKLSFESEKPKEDGSVVVWIRDGWETSDHSVKADARNAGMDSAVVFVFLPKLHSDPLQKYLLDELAANATLGKRGTPAPGDPGAQAWKAMETQRTTAEGEIDRIISEIIVGAQVFQGGGTEVARSSPVGAVKEAAEIALDRLYNRFKDADNPKWAEVYQKAQKGAPDALSALSYSGAAGDHPVCKEVLISLGSGKSGADVRATFESPPYGWTRDVVDGVLQVLLVNGLIRAEDGRGNGITADKLERKAIGKALFFQEAVTIDATQRITIRKLFQTVGLVSSKPDEDLRKAGEFLTLLKDLAGKAGGEPPRPPIPDTSLIDNIRVQSGNEQLQAIYNARQELTKSIEEWQTTALAITKRIPKWSELQRLSHHAAGIPDIDMIETQVAGITKGRQLLMEPDPVSPLVSAVAQMLREEINTVKAQWETKWNDGEERLKNDSDWAQIEDANERHTLRLPHGLTNGQTPSFSVETTEAILKTLDAVSLPAFHDKIAALPSRYDRLLEDVAKRLEPTARHIPLPNKTLKTPEDVDAWVEEIRELLHQEIEKGPVVL